MATEARKDRGRQLQQARAEITAALDKCNQTLGADAIKASGTPSADRDRSVPGVFPAVGHVHPLTQTIEEIVRIFSSLGFDLAEGPEVETEWYNFDALNITPDHPAREEYQSFYLGHGRAMRSQTSSVQIRVMEQRVTERGAVPVRIIAPGRVFRPDSIDATHHSTFHQVEGLWVDKGVTMADLKGVLDLFMKGLLGAETTIRFRPSFFTFMVVLLMYRYVPDGKWTCRDGWPGAVLATVLFELLKNLFALYITNLSSNTGAYGALGGILLFLLWTYLTSNILLIGAELAAEYPRVLRGDYDEQEASSGPPASARRRGRRRRRTAGRRTQCGTSSGQRRARSCCCERRYMTFRWSLLQSRLPPARR